MNNQPYPHRHIPQLAIDTDEVLAAIALELARVHICDQCHGTVPALIDNITQLAGEIARLHRTGKPTPSPTSATRYPTIPGGAHDA